MKLLIADDDPRIRTLLREICGSVATDTRDCCDGAEAVEAFGQFKPDWTIMDLGMPRLDGLAATKRIVASHPEARIVVITQHRGAEYEQAAREAGACAFVLKDNLQPLLSLLAAPVNSSANRNPDRHSLSQKPTFR